jgi:hypothetical protein
VAVNAFLGKQLEPSRFNRFQQALESGSGPGGRWFKSTRPDHFRVLGQKDAWRGRPVVRAPDWAAAILCFSACVALVLFGVFRPGSIQNLRIPQVVFGLLGIRISTRSIWRFTHPPTEKMFWWYVHLQGMIASYIAAWIAFCLVTLGPLLHGAQWLWLLPISVGLPAILVTTAYYRQKFCSRPEPGLQGA